MKSITEILLQYCIVLLISISTANAATYTFSQTGFLDGGFVTGSFTGKDQHTADGLANVLPFYPDGLIVNCSGRTCPFYRLNEVSNFSIHFGGNPTFDGLNAIKGSGLWSLLYDIKSNVLIFDYGTCDTTCIPYWVFNSFYGIKYDELALYLSSPNPIEFSEVPIPGALGLFLAAITSIAGIRRKQ